MTTVIVPLRAASEYESATYRILSRSEFVYHMAGAGLHNRHSPHRITLWDNTGKPNPDNGGPIKYGDYGPLPTGGNGAYIGPDNRATDFPLSVTTSAESTVITNNGTNTGTVASGQVYAPETLAIGDVVIFRLPDGTLSDPWRIRERSLSDPDLIII